MLRLKYCTLASAILLVNFFITAEASETMYISFDKGLNADKSTGVKEPVNTSNIKLTKGIVGNGVFIPAHSILDYAAAGNINKDAGTVSMWIKPYWTPNTRHLLPVARPKGETIRAHNLFFIGSKAKRNNAIRASINYGIGFMKRGTNVRGLLFKDNWVHLVFTWDRKKNASEIYINGQNMDSSRFLPAKITLGKLLHLSSLHDIDGCFSGLNGVMDEVRIFDRVLKQNEIKAQYAGIFPLSISPMDFAACIAKPRPLRVRFINFTKKIQKCHYELSVTKDKSAESILKTDFEINAAAGNTFIKSLNISLPEQGDYVFTLSTGGHIQKQWKVTAISNQSISAAMPESATGKVEMKLLEEINCAQNLPADKYRDDGRCRVVKSSVGSYRETTLRKLTSGFAYRFHIENPGKPHWLEIEYPDNARRMFYVAVFPYSKLYKRVVGHGNLDTIGIITGGSHPLTGQMQTKRMLFWPDSKDFMVACNSFRWAEDAGAAVAKIRLYENVGKIPKLKINYPAGQPSRTLAIWQEDPAMTGSCWFNRPDSSPETGFDFWRVKINRMVKYFRFSGKNAWSIETVDYYGDNTGSMDYILPLTHQCTINGRYPGWADLLAVTFEREGIAFYVSVNAWANRRMMERLIGKENISLNFASAVSKGVEAVELFTNKDQIVDGNKRLNPLHPKVKGAYLRILAAYRNKFSIYSNFKGVNFITPSQLFFSSGNIGYGDYSVGLFEKETAIVIPVDQKSYSRFSERYKWLRKNAWNKWIKWRCAKIAGLYIELLAEINRGQTRKLQIVTRYFVDSKHGDIGKYLKKNNIPKNPGKIFRESGVDIRILSKIKNLIVQLAIRPNYSRRSGSIDERYYNFSPQLASLFKGDAWPAVLVHQHANMEVYCHIAKSLIKSFWWDVYWRSRKDKVLAAFSTSQPDNKYLLETMTWLLAEADPWMIDHGFWGCPENGAMKIYQAFHRAYLSIPRVHFKKASGPDDPVTVRVYNSGSEHWFYLVNKAYYPVKVSFGTGSRKQKLLNAVEKKYVNIPKGIFKYKLKGHEVLVFKCSTTVSISNLSMDIPEKEKKRIGKLIKNWEKKLSFCRQLYGSVPSAALSIVKQAKKLFAEKRYMQAEHIMQSRILTKMAKELKLTLRSNLTPDGSLSVQFVNIQSGELSGQIKLQNWPKDLNWKPEKTTLSFRRVKPGELFKGTFRFKLPEFIQKTKYDFKLKMDIDGQKSLSREFTVTPYLAVAEPTSPVIDGDFSDWSKNSVWYVLDSKKDLVKKRVTRILGFTHYKAKFAWTWNIHGLSLAVEVADKDFLPPTREGAMYKNDSIQVYFDQFDNKSPSYDGNDLVYQLGLLNGKPVAWREYAPLGKGIENASDVKTAIKRVGGVTRYEAFFPFSEFTRVKIGPGLMLGFSIQINNRDKTVNGIVMSALPLNTIRNSWHKPDSWRDLLLIAEQS